MSHKKEKKEDTETNNLENMEIDANAEQIFKRRDTILRSPLAQVLEEGHSQYLISPLKIG